MKYSALFSLLIVAMSVLTACSKDIAPGQEQAAFDVAFSGIDIRAMQGSIAQNTIQLTNVLSIANRDKASSVKTVDIQNGKSYIIVQGEGVETLRKVTINLLDGSDELQSKVIKTYNLNLASFDSNGIEDSTNPCITFLSNITDYLASKKSANIQVILYAGAQELTNLQVTIHITAIFNW